MPPIDYSRYPLNWKKEIVPAVLKRANNCCELCGLQNHQSVWSIKLCVKNEEGKYKNKSIWFRNEEDAIREQGEWPPEKKKVVLTIAHLDHDETNHDVSLDRLKALCQICHLRYDSKEKYRRSLVKWEQPQLKLK